MLALRFAGFNANVFLTNPLPHHRIVFLAVPRGCSQCRQNATSSARVSAIAFEDSIAGQPTVSVETKALQLGSHGNAGLIIRTDG